MFGCNGYFLIYSLMLISGSLASLGFLAYDLGVVVAFSVTCGVELLS